MDVESESQLTVVSDSEVINPIIPRIGRLILAVLIALVALTGLCDRLSVDRHQAQAHHSAIVDHRIEIYPCMLRDAAQYIPTRCRHSVLSVTKHLAPAYPDTGSLVTITFVVTGVGPKPLDVVLLHDVSGSMKGTDTPNGKSRLEAAQDTAVMLANQLADTDRVAVVAFSETAPLTPVMSLTADVDAAITAIESLEIQDGGTNMGGGIRAGYAELISSTRWISKTAKAMIILSDGWASEPGEDPGEYAREQASAAGECGILIYSLGFGREISETLMQDLAVRGGGEYYSSPDSTDLRTIYQEIALELRNLVITDVLVPGVDLDCASVPDDWQCSKSSGYTTVTVPISNSVLVTDPFTLSFTATVNLDPGYEGPINTDDSESCYDGPGGHTCQSFENPTITVGGRKITGVVFEDLDQNGQFDASEPVISGVVVTTSSGLTHVTDIDGVYVFRTSSDPTLTVAIKIPPGFISTTSAVTSVPPVPGVHQWNFGLFPIIEGISLSVLSVEPDAKYHGDNAALQYSVRNHDQDDKVVSGTVFLLDSLGRNLDEESFALDPGDTIMLSSTQFAVPQDIVITITAVATYDILGLASFDDQIALTLCPTDTYEPDDNKEDAYPIYADESQIHDFYEAGNEDWVKLRLHRGNPAFYTFAAYPIGPFGLPMTLTFQHEEDSTIDDNLDNPQSPVQIVKMLYCTGADVCDYFLQMQSPSAASGCWTDYRLWVSEITFDNYIWLPVVLKEF